MACLPPQLSRLRLHHDPAYLGAAAAAGWAALPAARSRSRRPAACRCRLPPPWWRRPSPRQRPSRTTASRPWCALDFPKGRCRRALKTCLRGRVSGMRPQPPPPPRAPPGARLLSLPGPLPAPCSPRPAPCLAGFKVKISERGYFPKCDDPQLQMVLFRSQEIRWGCSSAKRQPQSGSPRAAAPERQRCRPHQLVCRPGRGGADVPACIALGYLHGLRGWGLRGAAGLGVAARSLTPAVVSSPAGAAVQPVCRGWRAGCRHLRL